MKKLKFNSTLDHKQSDYKTREIIVEKVITLYGKSFSELKNHPLSDNQYIAQNRELMYIDSNDTAHCLLMVDYDSGNGILVESEGSSYARKSQFIPNARELIENNDLTASERKLHNSLKKIVDHIAELAHCGEIYVSFWNDGNDWLLQTAEEMGFEQTEDLSESLEMNMTM